MTQRESASAPQEALELTQFIDACPSPFHACAEVAQRLEQAGFDRLFEEDSWDSAHQGAKNKDGVDKFFVWREGSIVAWVSPHETSPETGFRLVGAHTDSPNLRIKPRPDTGSANYTQLGVEVYGGVLLNSWLDRDLGLSGRVAVRSSQGSDLRLFRVDDPIMRVPQLAIHLDREIYTAGLQLNKQRHMSPVWGLGKSDAGEFKSWLAGLVDADAKDVLGWDAMCHDTNPSTVWGRAHEFVSAPRLDNLASCFAGLSALLARLEGKAPLEHIVGVCFFDHEEVGSGSHSGAGGSILKDILERSVIARGGSREDSHRAIANSICVSADMAHATHPNYVDRHEPDHFLEINGGPVIKINANMRYATDAGTEAVFQAACEEADVPFQKWVNRTDLGCGSTIGPMTAAGTGMRVVDVGNPMLAMHSIREMSGAQDPEHMRKALTVFLS